jgi:hypothetical protein
MLRGSTSLPTRAGFQTTIKVTGWGARPPHKRLPWSRTGSAGVVTLYRVAFTLSIGAEKVGTVPDGARGRDLPLPKVIRSGENIKSPVSPSRSC